MRGAILGPHGSGKTTLLGELHAHLMVQGWRVHARRFNTEWRAARGCAAGEAAYGWPLPQGLGARDVLLIDGAEQLGWREWRRMLRAARGAGGLVITAHGGRRLPLLHRCATDAALLADLVAELHPEAAHDPTRIEQLFARHRGDIRAALRQLYDETARNSSPPSRGVLSARLNSATQPVADRF